MNNSSLTILEVKETSEVFGSPLNRLAKLLAAINQDTSGGQLLVDLRFIGFVRPTLFLPLAALLHSLVSQGRELQFIAPEGSDLKAYLKTIEFPNGLMTLGHDSDNLHRFHRKTYLPIIRIPTGADANPNTSLITKAISAILNQAVNHTQSVQNALNYLVSECLDNIMQHACAEWGWIQMQVYPLLGFADLCIADTGRTFFGSYRDAQFDEVITDADAMMRALQGRSVKQTEMGRGFGISSSRKMLLQGLKGHHFLWSGTAATKIGEEHILQLPPELHFPGTLVAWRIPLTAPSNFSLYDYVTR